MTKRLKILLIILVVAGGLLIYSFTRPNHACYVCTNLELRN